MSDAAHVCWIQIYNTNSDQTNETTGMHRKMSSGSGSELCNTRIFFYKIRKIWNGKKGCPSNTESQDNIENGSLLA